MVTRVFQSAFRLRALNSISMSSSRCLATNVHKITPYMTLKTVDKNNDKNTPLVLFMPWLNAPSKAVDRYLQLYHGNGFNSLTVQGNVKHFLWPKTSIALVNEILNYLKSDHNQVPIFVHSFSIGSFLYTVLQMEMSNQAEFRALRKQIVGHVFDSITVGGLKKMGHGMAVSASGNHLVQKTIETIAATYFYVTAKNTVNFYDQSIDYFINRPLEIPSLYFHSQCDPMCCPESVNSIVSKWKNEFGLTVVQKCWPDSPHAGHFRMYPDEYKKLLEDFIKLCMSQN